MEERDVLRGRIRDLWNRTEQGDYLNHTGFLSLDLQSYARQVIREERLPVRPGSGAFCKFSGGYEEADRQMLEESVAQAQENLDYWDKYGWEVSQRDLDWYRGHDDNRALERVNWLYTDDTGEASNLIMQYMDGAIGIDEMLSGIDRKAQMMRLEGN